MHSRRLAALAVTAGLLGGGGAGMLLSGTSLAGAQSADTSTTTAAATPGADWHKSALDPLVASGTITQAQEDAVLAALDAARPAHGPGRGPANLDAAATALGMTTDELRTAVQSGKTLAAIAQEKGVDVSKVVDALVADVKAHLDQEVAAGTHTQAEADQKLADARTRIEAAVNGQGGIGFGGRGGHGPGAPAPAGVPGSTTTTS